MTLFNTSSSRSNWTTDLLILGLVLFLFYSFCITCYPLFTPDEGRYSEVAREMIATGDYITPRVDGVAFLDKPVLYYWLQAAAIRCFGVNEWAVRFFPMLIGILGCLITYACGRRLFDRRTGLLSAIILATSPLYFAGAHYANLDLEVAVFISTSLLLFLTGVNCDGWQRHALLISAYFVAALAFLTKGLIGIAFPAMITCAWIIVLWEWKILLKIHLVKGLLLFAAVVLPWYILVQQANPEFLHYFFVTQQVSRFLSAEEFNNPTPFWFYAPIVLVGIFPWTGFVFQAITRTVKRVWQARRAHQTELYLLLWLAIIFVFFSIPRSKTITYILPIFPALALLIGHTLSEYWQSAKRPAIYSGIAFIAIIAGVFALALLITPSLHRFAIRPGLIPHLDKMALIYLLMAIGVLLTLRQQTLLRLFVILVIANVHILGLLTFSAKHLNQNTAKPLALELKRIIRPEDEVITYFKFYQDVPFYLQRTVTIANNWKSPSIAENDNWARELWYGMPFQNTESWLIDETTFWQRWNSNRRIFVFLNENYFDQFKAGATSSYYFIGQYRDIYLLSNQPTALSITKMR